ncbi:isochorismatase family protein [Liquorilactobacillus oeni DSM 19972]|uniref:Isochorismatase family protein n=2 Tax=Liquorilactobacillus oeni TaxID=303241 RepID=A0A0R1M897_9LACO|nr:isochorismatase family protein [Liquorilactobacillus oeni DSM 19972]
MTKALLIIDYTNDFVATKGALTVGEPAQKIADPIVTLATQFISNESFVFLPTDVHTPGDPYHPETKLFPPHNVRGTWGRELYGPLAQWYLDNNERGNVALFDKTRYSSFAGTPLDIWLRERDVTEVHLVGVCTDICLLHTAVDAYNLNYSIVVHQKATATFKPGGQKWALDHFKTVLNAKIV